MSYLVLGFAVLIPPAFAQMIGSGDPPLIAATINQDVDAVAQLVKSGANLNASDRTGVTALHLAVGRGNVTIVELLVAAKADVNPRDIRGTTPLDWSTNLKLDQHLQRNYKIISQLLIQNGASINIFDAVSLGLYDLVEKYIVGGGDITMQQYRWGSLLDAAAKTCEARSAEILIKHGANVNSTSETAFTPLHQAAENGCPELAKLLIEAGANVNAITKDFSPMLSRYSALQLAAGHCETEFETPIVPHGDVGVVDVLIKAKADLNHRDSGGFTALHDASERNCKEVVRLLVSAGANPDQ